MKNKKYFLAIFRFITIFFLGTRGRRERVTWEKGMRRMNASIIRGPGKWKIDFRQDRAKGVSCVGGMEGRMWKDAGGRREMKGVG